MHVQYILLFIIQYLSIDLFGKFPDTEAVINVLSIKFYSKISNGQINSTVLIMLLKLLKLLIKAKCYLILILKD